MRGEVYTFDCFTTRGEKRRSDAFREGKTVWGMGNVELRNEDEEDGRGERVLRNASVRMSALLLKVKAKHLMT